MILCEFYHKCLNSLIVQNITIAIKQPVFFISKYSCDCSFLTHINAHFTSQCHAIIVACTFIVLCAYLKLNTAGIIH